MLGFAIVIGNACSDNNERHEEPALPSLPQLQLMFDEDQPIVIHPLVGVQDPAGAPLTITSVNIGGGKTAQITEAGKAIVVTAPANYFGMFTLVYIVGDGGSRRTSGMVVVVVQPVNDPPVAMNREITVKRRADLPLSGSDVEGDPVHFEIVAQPEHGVVTSASGLFTYVPDAEFAGDDRVVYRATDGKLPSEPATITLHVIADIPPTANPGEVTVPEDSPVAIGLSASDPDDFGFVFRVTAGPEHGALTGTPLDLTYTPGPEFSGDDALSFVADDGFRTSAPATITIHVTPVNDPPIAAPQTVEVNEDGSVAVTLSGSDVEGDALTFSITGSPFNGTLSPLVGATVTYTPRRDFNGTDVFSFRAFDGQQFSTTTSVTIHVAPVNDPPTAVAQSRSLDEDNIAFLTLTGNDPDADPLTFTVSSGPQHGTLSGTPPGLVYTPNLDYNGPDAFSFTVSDRTETSAPATVSLTVRAVNDPPVARDATFTIDEDTPITITLPVTDVDSASLNYFIRSFPSDGSVTLSGASLTYRPARNANGTRSLTYFASDTIASSNIATITFQITAVNDGPLTTDDYLATDPGVPVSFTVIGNDVDPEGDPFHFDSVEHPAHGTIEVVDDHLVYTPDAGFTGIDVFAYTVIDSHDAASTGNIHIGVGQFPPGAPTEAIASVVADTGDRTNAASISDDGRYIAFVTSSALVPEDTNGLTDVYVYDRGHREVTRVSVASDGTQANSPCRRPQISANGRYVVFDSAASNLVAGDSNSRIDVFRHDRTTGETVRISVPFTASGSGGGSAATVSDDGNLVAFGSTAFDLVPDDVNGASDVFIRDVAAGTTTRVSVSLRGDDGDLGSSEAVISGDGTHVAFSSLATNLTANDGNGLIDVFVRDLAAGTTVRASVSSTGGEANELCDSPAVSRDGRFVSFETSADNLVPPPQTGARVYVRDTQALITTRPVSTTAVWGRLSGDGRYLVEQVSAGVGMIDRFAAAAATLPGSLAWFWPVMSSNGRYVVVLDNRPTGVVVTVAANPFGP